MYFDSYEVHPVRESGGNQAQVVSDAEADFWSVYGKVDNFYCAIGDYESREIAELVAEMLDKKTTAYHL